MIDVLLDTLIDTAKLLPFLFLSYLAMEYMEHKLGEKMQNALETGKDKWFMPALGSLCGCVPQCGFSAAASGLYAGRVISLGTLIAIYLSTSDEMLPIMISRGENAKTVIAVILLKVVYGMLCGILIDLFARKRVRANDNNAAGIHELCEHDHCHCEKGIWFSALKHTLQISLFILIIVFAINTAIFLIGEESIKSVFLNAPVVGELVSGLVGLIPNCAASVMITELYLNGLIGFGSMMAGLFVGAGVGLLVLFRLNNNLKQNLIITGMLYAVGTIGGLIIDLTGLTI